MFLVFVQLPHDLRFPLVTMIGYLGHRVLAVATMPLSADTLSYGQSENGTEFITTQESLAKEVFSTLHLKPHVSRLSGSSHLVYGPSEVESAPPFLSPSAILLLPFFNWIFFPSFSFLSSPW